MVKEWERKGWRGLAASKKRRSKALKLDSGVLALDFGAELGDLGMRLVVYLEMGGLQNWKMGEGKLMVQRRQGVMSQWRLGSQMTRRHPVGMGDQAK